MKHKLVVEIDQKGYTDRDERKEKIEKELGCKFIRSNPDKKKIGEYVKFNRQDFKKTFRTRIQVKSFNKVKVLKMDCPENIAFRLKMICLVCERRKQMMNTIGK